MAIVKRVIGAVGAALAALFPAPRTIADADRSPSYAAVFDKAFAPDFEATIVEQHDGERATERVQFRTVTAGRLKLPSGRIAAADPFIALADAKPLAQHVPPGIYPVRLAVADFPSGGLRVAFARVDFKATKIARWSLALLEGQDIATLKGNEIFGYGVDAGTGAFFGPEATKAAARLLDANPDAWEDWQTEGEANGPKVVGPHVFLLDLPLEEANAIMFSSGWGDGFYASWFGYDAAGNVAALVTDFATIDWSTADW